MIYDPPAGVYASNPQSPFGQAFGSIMGQYRQGQEAARAAGDREISDLSKIAQLNIQIRQQRQQQQAAEQKRQAQARQAEKLAAYGAGLDPEQRRLFEAAPDKYLTQASEAAFVSPKDRYMNVGGILWDVGGDQPQPIQNAANKKRIAPGDIAGLRKEFVGQAGTFKDVRDSFKRIAASEPNAQGDLALIFGYMKMLDPGSVVRETEFATAQNAAGVPQIVRNLFNQVQTGERLSPEQRRLYLGQASNLYEQQRSTHVAERQAYSQIGVRMGIDPVDVVSAVSAPTLDEILEGSPMMSGLAGNADQTATGQTTAEQPSPSPRTQGAQADLSNLTDDDIESMSYAEVQALRDHVAAQGTTQAPIPGQSTGGVYTGAIPPRP